MTDDERRVADELLRQAGCEPVGSPLLGPWSNVLPSAGSGKMLMMLAAWDEMLSQGTATDRHQVRAFDAMMMGLRGRDLEVVWMDEKEPEQLRVDAFGWSDLGDGAVRVEFRKPKYEHEQYAYVYAYKLPEPTEDVTPVRPWRRVRSWWSDFRWRLGSWVMGE